MSKKTLESRRNFLKVSAMSAAGLSIMGPMAKKARGATITTTLANLSTTPINTDVSNLRVAFITDATPGTVTATSMVRTTNYPGWGSFNNPTNTTTGVNYTTVKANMDKLACALASKTNATEAWATLLKIPSNKTWGTAKAVIKPNAFAGDHPSIPIVSKICEVLIGFGMPAGNITICDTGGDCGIYLGTGKCPSGVLTSSERGNTVAWPASAGGESFGAATAIDGADILVNIGCNKGHNQYSEYSGVTMCQKNMKGAIWFNCGENDATKGTRRLVNTNSCSYIVGNIPTTYPARQQLCIVDSLWMGDAGDWGGGISNGNNGNSILMATFPGAVDYVTTMKVRVTKMAASTWNQPIVDRFITGYGYTAADITTVMTPVGANVPGPGLVDAGTTEVVYNAQENPNLSRQGVVQVSVSGNGARTFNSSLSLSKGETVQSAEIISVQGRKIRTLALNSGSNRIVWDGRTDSGSLAKAGTYVLKIKGQKTVIAGDVILSR
jgi:hypothetical protein